MAFYDKAYIRNHPQGKMKKIYKGENPLLYTGEYALDLPEGADVAAAKAAEKARDHYAFSSHVMAPTPGPHHQDGHCPDLPEHPPVEEHDGL